MARSFKVDNWGTLLLQRIQQLYDRGEHCDILLKFHTGEEIPIHRLVLHACCSFFAVLEGTEALEDTTLHLPAELTKESLEPVIRFMYTGQLDIGEGSVPSLVATAQFLDMPLLEQLLQTHALSAQNTATSAAPSAISTSPVAPPKAQQVVKKAVRTQSASPRTKAQARPELLPAGPSRIDLEVGDSNSREFGSLPKLSELLMDAPSATMNPPLLPLLRKTQGASPKEFAKRDPKKVERTFDELRKTTTNTAAVRRAATSEAAKAPDAKRLREEDIEGFKELLAEQRRRSELAAEQGEDTTTYDASAADVGLDDWEEEEDEDEEEQEPVPGTVKSESPNKSQQHKSILKSDAMSPAGNEAKRVHFMVNDESAEAEASTAAAAVAVEAEAASSGGPENSADDPKNLESLTAATETAAAAAPGLVANSSVATGSSPSSQPDKDSSTITIFNESAQVLLREVVHSNAMSSQVQGRMIAEVLKRNPTLVSAGRNTKLKIVQRSPWWAKARVSFVLLKPTGGDAAAGGGDTADAGGGGASASGKPSILRQHNSSPSSVSRKTGASGLGSSGAIAVNKRVSPFDNVTGPWICYDCIHTTDDGQNAALRLKTYYEYRTHLIQNHGFKPDSQACEFCGHRAVKRNHMLYHLFTVHGVPPPAHTKFPQCHECDYVALTASIMRKHLQKHQEGSENQCRVCSEPFASQQTLQQHLNVTGHLRGHTRNNPCPADGCNREFARGMNLKAHIRTCHKELAKQLDEEGWPVRLEPSHVIGANDVAVDEGVLLEAETVQQGDQGDMTWVTQDGDQVVQLAHGESFAADGTLVTVDTSGASEAEALSNMASSIATSLGIPMGTATTVTTTEDGITVAYLTTGDEHAQYIAAVDQDGTPVTLVTQDHVDEGQQQQHQHQVDEQQLVQQVQPMEEQAAEDDESSKAIEQAMMQQ